MHPGVEDFFLKQDNEWKATLYQVRELILNAAPGIEERFSYKTPFYYYKKPMIYFAKNKTGFYLGFVDGAKMIKQDWFSGQELKQIRHFDLVKWNDKQEEKLRFLIQEAISIKLRKK